MATTTFSLVISGAASTSVTVTQVAGLTAPVAAGTKVADIAVQPAGWTGGITLDGPDAAKLQVSGNAPAYFLTAATQLASGTYTATVTTTP
jgi:hypothetical protein